MKFCSSCGGSVTLEIPEGDNRQRYVCIQCETIHYQNPNIVAGCIAEWQGKILLCKRAIQPRYGLWTLPAGFMENGESTEDAAKRETREEAGAEIDITGLYGLFSIPQISQVYMLFRGTLAEGAYQAGVESLECMLFDENSIPWDQLAFEVVRETLRRYFRDKAGNNGFPLQIDNIIRHPVRR